MSASPAKAFIEQNAAAKQIKPLKDDLFLPINGRTACRRNGQFSSNFFGKTLMPTAADDAARLFF
jgi:hypothetical protein